MRDTPRGFLCPTSRDTLGLREQIWKNSGSTRNTAPSQLSTRLSTLHDTHRFASWRIMWSKKRDIPCTCLRNRRRVRKPAKEWKWCSADGARGKDPPHARLSMLTPVFDSGNGLGSCQSVLATCLGYTWRKRRFTRNSKMFGSSPPNARRSVKTSFDPA